MKGSLVRRVMGLFLLASLPVALGPFMALVGSERVMQQAMADRIDRTESLLRSQLDRERTRLVQAVQRWLDGPAFHDAAQGGIPGQWAAPPGVDLFEVARVAPGHPGSVLYSLHLPVAVGDPPDATGPSERTEVSYARVLVRGNPPYPVPALVARRSRPSEEGRVAVMAGIRLDPERLQMLGRLADARIELIDARLPAPNASDTQVGLRSILLDGPGGPRLDVRIHPGPWPQVRRSLLLTGATALVATALLAVAIAFVFGRTISRPIVSLSGAAARLASGDLTARVHFRGTDELGQLGLDFNDMALQLERQRQQLRRAERMAAWREVARRVAHEVKNPLFPIRLAVETIQKSTRRGHPELPQIVDESTDTVLREVAAIDRLVSEFTQFARLPPPERCALPAKEVIQPVLAAYADLPISLEWIDLTERNVHLDPELTRRALHNLIQNARDALVGGDGQRVLITTRQDGAGTWLTVEDDGPGLPEPDPERILEPYYTTKDSGTGLGLAIVERIVNEHGGELTVGRGSLGGAAFTAYFPDSPAPDGSAAA